MICKSLCDHCGLTGFYCGDECICETPEGQEENIQCLATMHSNCIALNVPWEIMIKGSSGHYYLRDRLAEVIDERMNEHKNKLEEAGKQQLQQEAEVTEISKPKISVKKVNQLPKLKVKTIKSKKPEEQILIIRETRQIGEGNENVYDKNILQIDQVAAPAAAAETVQATPDAIVGDVATAVAVAPPPPPAKKGFAFKKLTPIKFKPLKIASATSNIYLGDKGVGAAAVTTSTTLPPPTRRFGTILRETFQNSKLGASIQTLGSNIGQANPFANINLGRQATAAEPTSLGAPAPNAGAPENGAAPPVVGAAAPTVEAAPPVVGAPPPTVGADSPVAGPPSTIITQPAHTL